MLKKMQVSTYTVTDLLFINLSVVSSVISMFSLTSHSKINLDFTSLNMAFRKLLEKRKSWLYFSPAGLNGNRLTLVIKILVLESRVQEFLLTRFLSLL